MILIRKPVEDVKVNNMSRRWQVVRNMRPAVDMRDPVQRTARPQPQPQPRQQAPVVRTKARIQSCRRKAQKFERNREGVFEVQVDLQDQSPSYYKAMSSSTFYVITHSHFDFDTENTLLQQDVPDSIVNKVSCGLTGVKHEAIRELHRFSTGCT